MHLSITCSTTPSALRLRALTGQADTQEGSSQWKQAAEILRWENWADFPAGQVWTHLNRNPGGASFWSWQAISQE